MSDTNSDRNPTTVDGPAVKAAPSKAAPAKTASKAAPAKTAGPGRGNVATTKTEPTTPPPGRSGISPSVPQEVRLVGDGDHQHGLTAHQYELLLRPLAESRVQQLQTGSRAKYVESWDVIRYLDRIFGLTGWSDEVEYRLVSERIHPDPRQGKTGEVVSVVYTASVVLTIKCPVCGGELTHFSDVGGGDQLNQPLNNIGDAHGSAAKGAVSDALKRCARKLGDQFGLPLYEKGVQPVKDVKGVKWYPAVVGSTAVPPTGSPVEVRTDDTVTGGDDVPEPAEDAPAAPQDSAVAAPAPAPATTTTQAHGGRPTSREPAPAAIPIKDCPAPEGAQLRDGHGWIDSSGGGAGQPRRYVCTRKHGMVLPEAQWESDTPLPIEMPAEPVYGPSGMDTFVSPKVEDVALPEPQGESVSRMFPDGLPPDQPLPYPGAAVPDYSPEAAAAIVNAFPGAEQITGPLGTTALALRNIINMVPDITSGMATFFDQIVTDWPKLTGSERHALVDALAKRCNTTGKLKGLYGLIAQNFATFAPSDVETMGRILDEAYLRIAGVARPKSVTDWANVSEPVGEPVL